MIDPHTLRRIAQMLITGCGETASQEMVILLHREADGIERAAKEWGRERRKKLGQEDECTCLSSPPE